MKSTAPKIGFDRYIQLDWAETALKIRAGSASIDDLNALLDAAELTVAAKKKVRTVLNRLWLEPRPELADFANRGIAIFKANPAVSTAALCWGVAIATYPFFGKVADLVGRLTSLQGDCTSAEVHRRMSELYGEREGTYRMTNMVLQSQASWGAIERTDKGKRVIRRSAMRLTDAQIVAWVVEAALRYAGKAMAVPTLQSMPLIYPFVLDQSLAYVASKSAKLEIRTEGSNSQFVGLREETASTN